jgi:hypothetical protein
MGSVLQHLPRLSLEGALDLTYRCNNTCRHRWVWLPPGAPDEAAELSLDEIRRIVDEARTMGCQSLNPKRAVMESLTHAPAAFRGGRTSPWFRAGGPGKQRIP